MLIGGIFLLLNKNKRTFRNKEKISLHPFNLCYPCCYQYLCTMSALKDIKQPVILFDGVCNLCNGAVQYVVKHDTDKCFLFASLQSQFGQQVLAAHQLSNTNFNSFILLQNGIIFQRSTAALLVAKQLTGVIRLLYWFIIVPRFIRDGVYNIIAKNRYKWFGKKEACWLPTPDLRSRFLD